MVGSLGTAHSGAPLLHIYVANYALVVTDPECCVYLGSDSQRVDEQAALGSTWAVVHVQNLTSQIGFSLLPTPSGGWNVFADPDIEATLIDSDGEHYDLLSSVKSPSGVMRGGCLMSAGLNLIIAGTEEIQLFVPPQEAQIVGAGKMAIEKRQEQPSWHPETIRRRREASNQVRREELERSRAQLDTAFQKKLDEIAQLSNPEAVDRHNLNVMQEIDQKVSKRVVRVDSLRSRREETILIFFDPDTGGIILSAPGNTIPQTQLKNFSRAHLKYTHPDFAIVGVEWPEDEKPEISAQAYEALLRLPSVWEKK